MKYSASFCGEGPPSSYLHGGNDNNSRRQILTSILLIRPHVVEAYTLTNVFSLWVTLMRTTSNFDSNLYFKPCKHCNAIAIAMSCKHCDVTLWLHWHTHAAVNWEDHTQSVSYTVVTNSDIHIETIWHTTVTQYDTVTHAVPHLQLSQPWWMMPAKNNSKSCQEKPSIGPTGEIPGYDKAEDKRDN